MPKLKVLSGKNVVKILKQFGFLTVGQKGSHIKLQRTVGDGVRQSLTIPNHKELGRGTLRDIYNQALRYLSEKELAEYFFNT